VPIALLLGLKSFSSTKTAFLLGVLFALSFGISSSVLFVIGAVMLSFALVDFSRDKRKEFLSLIFGFILIFPLMMLWHQDIWRQNFDLHMPSFFQALVVLTLFLMLSPLIFLKRLKFILIAYSMISLVVGFLVIFSPMQNLLDTALHYVFGRTGIINHVIEARPLLEGLVEFQFAFILDALGYLFPILFGFFLLPLFWKRLLFAEKFYFLTGFFLLIPALAQKRFVIYFLIFYLIFLVFCFRELLNFFQEKGIRVQIPLIIGFVLMPIFPGLKSGFAPDLDSRMHVDFSILHMANEEGLFDSKEAWKRLGETNPNVGGVWTNPTLGHLITYISGMGSLVDSFYISSSMSKDFQGRKIEEEKEFLDFLEENKIELVFLVNDYLYFHMIHRAFGERPEGFGRRGPNQAFSIDVRELERFFWVRSILQGVSWRGFEEVLKLQVMENHLYNFSRVMRRKKDAD